MTATTVLFAIGIFYAGLFFGLLVSALCISAKDEPPSRFTLRLITFDPITGEHTSARTITLPLPHAHAEN